MTMKNEYKELAEKLLFDFGKAVLGKNAGGLIAQLLRARGIDGTRLAIIAAQGKQNPREYAGAMLKEPVQENSAQIGEVIGKYRYNGSIWVEMDGNI
jgi:hypothetical protein